MTPGATHNDPRVQVSSKDRARNKQGTSKEAARKQQGTGREPTPGQPKSNIIPVAEWAVSFPCKTS